MKKIVGIIRPFLARWEIQTYQNGFLIQDSSVEADINSFPNFILERAKEEEIKEVYLLGPAQFTQKVKAEILKRKIEKYDDIDLTISLVG